MVRAKVVLGAMVVLFLAQVSFGADFHRVEDSDEQSWFINPGGTHGTVGDWERGFDGDWDTYAQATSNGSGSEAIVGYIVETWFLPAEVYDPNLYFKVEASSAWQNSLSVEFWHPQTETWDTLWHVSDATGLFEEALEVPKEYIDSQGQFTSRVMLWSKHSTSAWTRLYDTRMTYKTSHREDSDSQTWFINPGGEEGDITDPEKGTDGDWDSYAQATSNGSASEAIVVYFEETWSRLAGASNIQFHFKVEASLVYQNSLSVEYWNPDNSSWDQAWHVSNATGLFEEALDVGKEYVDESGMFTSRVMLWSKHSTSAWTRLYDTAISYETSYHEDACSYLHYINPGGGEGYVTDPEKAYDGDWSTYTQVTSNGSHAEAIVWYLEETWCNLMGAYDVEFVFHVEASMVWQNSLSVEYWNPGTGGWDPRWHTDNAVGDFGVLALEVPLYYIDQEGQFRSRMMLFSKHSTSAWTRLYETALRYKKQLTVLQPNGGEVLMRSKQYSFKWTAGVAADPNVNLEYSVDNGLNWVFIDQVADVGEYLWTLPLENSNQCLVRITDARYPYYADTSDATFTIFECQTGYRYLGQFGNTGLGIEVLNQPSGVTVDTVRNRVYVSDSANDCVKVYTMSGTYVGTIGSFGHGDAQFDNPVDVALDSVGNLYIADHNNFRIQVFDATGAFLGWFGKDDLGGTGWHAPGSSRVGASGNGDGEFKTAWSIAVGPDDTIYVSDESNHRVQKFDSSGTFLLWWGKDDLGGIGPHNPGSGRTSMPGNEEGAFHYARGITVDAAGYVYVADGWNYRVQKFDALGHLIGWWGLDDMGYTGWHNPGSGRMGVKGNGEGQFDTPFGITIDHKGYVWVCDYELDRVQKFTNRGIFITLFGRTGSGEGELQYPRHIDADTNGVVYVVDKDNARIQTFEQMALPAADLNGDCAVNLIDFSMFCSAWLWNGNPFDG